MALNEQQDKVAQALVDAIFDPEVRHITISGPAGSGKTYMLSQVVEMFNELSIINPLYNLDWVMAATTNKAAAVLDESFAGTPVVTIGTFAKILGFTVSNKTNKLIASREVSSNLHALKDKVLVIDESSYLDEHALHMIQSHTRTAALVVYVGDEYQLPPVNGECHVFNEAFGPQYRLTHVERQADGSPLQAASLALRESVATQTMPQLELDGIQMQWLPREDFVPAFVKDLISKPAGAVRALAWKNATARYYNDVGIHAFTGRTELSVGDIVICNSFHLNKRARLNIPSEAMVRILRLGEWEVDEWGNTSRDVETQYGIVRVVQDPTLITPSQWMEVYADLRFAYASTVNKAQGSTFDTVYVDLDDINQCYDFNLKLRLVYVAASRARHRVVFTGDLTQ